MFGFMPRGFTDQATAGVADETGLDAVGREERRVVLWRYWQARQLGTAPAHARLFAASRGDIGALRTLVARRGCPPDLAVDILV